jgi:hypothetical protein
VPPPETNDQDPALLEWYPQPIHSLCPLAIEVQELRAQVGYLQSEAQRNIEPRTELHENYCKVVAEARELRETVNNLAEQQKLEEARGRLDANRSKEFEITINTKIAARKSDEIECELQLRRELKDAVKREIDMRWTERIQTWKEMAQTAVAPMEGITTNDNPTPPVGSASQLRLRPALVYKVGCACVTLYCSQMGKRLSQRRATLAGGIVIVSECLS